MFLWPSINITRAYGFGINTEESLSLEFYMFSKSESSVVWAPFDLHSWSKFTLFQSYKLYRRLANSEPLCSSANTNWIKKTENVFLDKRQKQNRQSKILCYHPHKRKTHVGERKLILLTQSCQPDLADVHDICDTVWREEFIGTTTFIFYTLLPCHWYIFFSPGFLFLI